MKNAYLIEDHDQALKIWRRRHARGRDLVHIDAHIDLHAPAARSVEQVLEDARSPRDVKKGLEDLIAFEHYQKDLGKQTHIGNYIYPALREGIVRDFYWVVPGRLKDFRRQVPLIKQALRHALGAVASVRLEIKQGAVIASYLGHRITACCLDSLPVFREPVLLDVDTDFFITPHLDAADPARYVGRHRAWIAPQDVVGLLREKGIRSFLTTVAYSVRGGFTPARFRHFGRAFAVAWEGRLKDAVLHRQEEAAKLFSMFEKSAEASLYRRAMRLDPGLRYADNHNGFLYLARHRLKSAEQEFLRVLRADPAHAGAWLGQGDVASGRRDYRRALSFFRKAERFSRRQKSFKPWVPNALLGQLQCLVKLGHDQEARSLCRRLKKSQPLNPEVYYLAGVLSQKTKDYRRAALYFQDAIRLGYQGIESLERLSKISCFFDPKDAIIDYADKMTKRLARAWRRAPAKTRGYRAMWRRIKRLERARPHGLKDRL